MKNTQRLIKLAAMLLCGAVVLAPGDRSWSEEGFYVVGGGSPWKRNGTNIYYNKGNVGIGITDPGYLFHIFTTSNPVPMRVQTDATGADANAIQASANYGVAVSGYTVTGKGVLGNAQGGAVGVQGECTGYGAGVYGYNSGNGPGVRGYSAARTGVFGETSSTNWQVDAGVLGKCFRGILYSCPGVKGESDTTGVVGISMVGVLGETNGSLYGPGWRAGVSGRCNGPDGYGVIGSSTDNTSFAVFSMGNFGCSGNADITGNLVVHGSTKAAVVATSQGNKKLYCQESPEVWFEDVGEGQLSGGKAHIDLDPIFLETVTINEQHPLKVFIQLNDDCHGVYVQRQATGFEVKELSGGNSDAHFTYRVMAKRQGFETARLESAPDHVKVAALPGPQK